MKAKKILALALTLVFLSSCTNTVEKTPAENTGQESIEESVEDVKNEEVKTEKENEKEEIEEDKRENIQELSIDDEWIVDGQWKLKINSVTTSYQRNEFEETDPSQVVIVNYSYENIGFTDPSDFMDGLYLEPYYLVDEEGNMAQFYTAVESLKYPQETPVGAKMNNVSSSFGLEAESNEVKVYFIRYDGNDVKQKAIFRLPVEK